MDARIFDVLADGVGDDFAVLRHGVHFYFLGILDKLADDDGMFLGHVGG